MAVNTENIVPGVQRIIRALATHTPDEISQDCRLTEDLGLDSVRLIELAMAIELGFRLPPIDMDTAISVRTVGDVVTLVTQLKSGE